jgi:DnaK suppressor protein
MTNSTLTPQDLEALQQALDQREAQLHGEVQSAKTADDEDREGFQGVAPDMVDIAQSKRITDFRHAESERDKLELTEIDHARERMKDGTYGECTDCSVDIALARLKAEPTATRCIDCQEAFEKAHPGSAAIVVPTGRDFGATL